MLRLQKKKIIKIISYHGDPVKNQLSEARIAG